MNEIPELGIGIIYFSGFKNVIESNYNLIDTIEIEPQTFWIKNRKGFDSFIFNEKEINYIESIDKPKLFHGVGYPIAGSLPVDPNHIFYLKKMMQRLKPIWLSEHLSFNNIEFKGDIYNTNFLLPPLQTYEGIKVATKNIKKYSSNFNVPFLFETGTNYLQPHNFEINDGTFVNSIANNSDSYILLDIHNLLANQKNGRQTVLEFINQIDLDRIIQIHIAGGFDYKGYYLDAHSGTSCEEVFLLFEKIVKMLPNLKAITFEMLPDYLNFVSKNDIQKQLERMRLIWDKRGVNKKNYSSVNKIVTKNKTGKFIPRVKEWETTLGCLAIEKEKEKENKNLNKKIKNILDNDKGIPIIQELVRKFRSSLLVSTLKYTCRYIMLKYGIEVLNSVFNEFWQNSKPKLFPSDSGLEFGSFLINNSTLEDKLLKDLVLFETNYLKTLIHNEERIININFNPYEVVNSLSQKKLPTNITFGNYEIVLEAPNSTNKEPVSLVYHN